REQLAGAPRVLELPTDRPRPAVQSYRGAQLPFRVEQEVKEALEELSRGEGVTMFMNLLAAWQTLLSRYSGAEDIVVGTPVAGRNQRETEELIGFFVNTLVLRTDLSGEPTFRELLGRVREVCLGAYAHQELPFEKLVDELGLERELSHAPLFQVMLTLQNAPRETLELRGLRLSQLRAERETVKFDLTLTMTETKQGLVGALGYNTDLFEATTAERVVRHLQWLLARIVAAPGAVVTRLALMTESERQQVVYEWNETERAYEGLCAHELFAAEARRRPAATAVSFGAEQVSYGELNRRANQLGHYLRGLGVGLEVVVGISLPRSLELLVGVLGVLKAGGAYLPLDAAYPAERLAYMMKDAGIGVLLSGETVPGVKWSGAVVVNLEREWDEIAKAAESNPESGTSLGNLAYVIYTSGSTGKPKGVQVEHGGLSNLAQAQAEAFGVTSESRVLQFASFNFDASVSELFATWAGGGTLCLGRAEELLPGAELDRKSTRLNSS